eukprot:TRINITY_DN112697_c0_g1_i1.p1 TRINITY_DN112697_c0_g1~~TRINITY_DN112697_c0_g1_i1.p1  ORF type:complete len:361 (-),score=82.92 TRINITY_DN112697_c0_g1_i1:21-1103(-)
MGNVVTCCQTEGNHNNGMLDDNAEAAPVLDGPLKGSSQLKGTSVFGASSAEEFTYRVLLSKMEGGKLGMDVDFMAERTVLPVMNITGGLAKAWNSSNPERQINKGDSIVEVNGVSDNIHLMLEKCKSEQVLELTLCRSFNYDFLIQDLEGLIEMEGCGPMLIAGMFNSKIGCPEVAMRLGDKASVDVGSGLPAVAVGLLKPIAEKYCPKLISKADLCVLAANTAIKMMGGPEIPVRYGRVDGKFEEGILPEQGKLPDEKGAALLRQIFHPSFNDKCIVALSGAHVLERSHQNGAGFDNGYFKRLLDKPQDLLPDMALVEDAEFKGLVQRYAENQEMWFRDFASAWAKLQELGCTELREIL